MRISLYTRSRGLDCQSAEPERDKAGRASALSSLGGAGAACTVAPLGLVPHAATATPGAMAGALALRANGGTCSDCSLQPKPR